MAGPDQDLRWRWLNDQQSIARLNRLTFANQNLSYYATSCRLHDLLAAVGHYRCGHNEFWVNGKHAKDKESCQSQRKKDPTSPSF
jgi:hypothetical protein